MKILTFSTLYPNNIRPRYGTFIERRLRHLLSLGEIEARVVAPVPWFPFSSERFGRYAKFSGVEYCEERSGITVYHPQYFVIPKVGMNVTPFFLAISAYSLLRKLISRGYDFELIDAHYYYPDGVAAALLGKWLNKPVVISARGSDITLIPQHSIPRKMILWAAEKAKRSITVCQALNDGMVDLGADRSKIITLRNGVELDLFFPGNRPQLRAKLDITKPALLSVGTLIELKGHYLIIQALKLLPDYQLLIVGEGIDAGNLKKLAEDTGVSDRVSFLGTLPHAELVEYYCAADILVLASSSEGWANVLLESMACGTPVIATRVWGTPEVVTQPDAGLLIDDRSAEGIAKGVTDLMKNPPSRESTRKYAENFSWDSTAQSLKSLFGEVIETSRDGQTKSGH